MAIIRVKFPSTCKVCGGKLPKGESAEWREGMGVRCIRHGPWPTDLDDYRVIVLPPGRAQGAVDSTKKTMRTKRDVRSGAIAARGGAWVSPGKKRHQSKASIRRKRRQELREANESVPVTDLQRLREFWEERR